MKEAGISANRNSSPAQRNFTRTDRSQKMDQFKKFVQKNILLVTVILLFLGTGLFLHTPRSPEWDESVYILTGKHLFSGGEIGLLEP